MTRALALVLFLVAIPAAADSTTRPAPAAATTPRHAASAAAETKAVAKPTECKKVVVGRGLERRVVCEITVPVTVTTDVPRPNVIMVQPSGRAVVGRPRSENRLNGLSQRLN